MGPSVPTVKIAYHTDTDCTRRPDSEMCPGYAVDCHGMCPQNLIDRIMYSRTKLFRVLFCDHRIVPVYFFFYDFLFSVVDEIFILKRRFLRNQYSIKSCLICTFHGIYRLAVNASHRYGSGIGKKCLNQ